MWHEVALPGMVVICLLSRVDTPASLRRSGPAYLWAGPSRHHFAARESGRSNGELGLDELRGALAQALASVGRAGVSVTVRIRVVILRLSSGGKGQDLAWTGSDGVAEGHKRQATLVFARPSAPDLLLGRLRRQRFDYFAAFTTGTTRSSGPATSP
jgi:hypothetical protein